MRPTFAPGPPGGNPAGRGGAETLARNGTTTHTGGWTQEAVRGGPSAPSGTMVPEGRPVDAA
ncbi:hypothetical protein GCM10010272_28290 [Streptomyces lateritius]|nr:hypothetical protein GCM10010272_28290 [Streptomyces lateritius]